MQLVPALFSVYNLKQLTWITIQPDYPRPLNAWSECCVFPDNSNISFIVAMLFGCFEEQSADMAIFIGNTDFKKIDFATSS